MQPYTIAPAPFLGTPVVHFFRFYFGVSLLKLNMRKKGTLIIKGLLGNLGLVAKPHSAGPLFDQVSDCANVPANGSCTIRCAGHYVGECPCPHGGVVGTVLELFEFRV